MFRCCFIILCFVFCFFFFFKQKTAYEMRISDWSSDVCSSDLRPTTATKPERNGITRCEPRPTPRLAQAVVCGPRRSVSPGRAQREKRDPGTDRQSVV